MNLPKFFNHDFEKSDFRLFNKNKEELYFENYFKYWEKRKFDNKGNEIYFENSKGYIEDEELPEKIKTDISELKKLRLHTETFIDSSHYLKEYSGKCKNLHGHTWRVRVWIEGYPNEIDEVGILFDFGNLKNIKEMLDHKCLNDLDQFKDKNPTAENITMFIYNHFKEIKPNLDFVVRVYETSLGKITYAEYGDFKI